MKIINPDTLLKEIETELSLLSLIEKQSTIKVQTLKIAFIVFKKMIERSTEEIKDERN